MSRVRWEDGGSTVIEKNWSGAVGCLNNRWLTRLVDVQSVVGGKAGYKLFRVKGGQIGRNNSWLRDINFQENHWKFE